MKLSAKVSSMALSLIVLMTVSGCSIFLSGDVRKTKIIAAPYGSTIRMKQFRVGEFKPSGHVIWGNDIPEGARCSIVISNVSTANQVYRHDFVFDSESTVKGFNYFRGGVLEIDPYWHYKVGRFVVALYVKDQRVSTDTFDILP